MDGPHLGCAWYPEHWPEARWPRDLSLMRQASFTVVRVAEFAWSRLQPRADHLDLDWLARAVDAAHAHGLRVVIGTPTSAPPAWLSAAHPEVLPVAENGGRATHGRRGHFIAGSPVYQGLCRPVVEALARRFGAHPAVLGWQLDNECAGSSYDPDTQARFQAWLRARYRTLETLNARWVTAYWSQAYSDWSQIPLPRRAPGEEPPHPSLLLAWRRFITDEYRGYFGMQAAIIRAHAGAGQWITHNFFGNANLDRHALAAELDLAAYDAYVGQGDLDPLELGFDLDLARGLKRQNFWLMETQPGHVNWARVNDDLPPGGVRALVWHAVGHGADAALFWQWRPAQGGQEQYHGSLLAPDGEPRPLYAEVARAGRELREAAPLLSGTRPQARVALLDATEDRWALDAQRHHQDFDPLEHLRGHYRALRAAGCTVDIVHPSAPLDGYALVVAPQLHLLDEALAGRLAAFARGGHLVLGPRSGVKTPENTWWPRRGPGPLSELLGAHVEEFYALGAPLPVHGVWGETSARVWGEWLRVASPDTEVLMRYGRGHGWLANQPAAVTRPLGRGRISLLGTWLDPAGMRAAAGWMLAVSGLTPIENLPEGVELCRRVGTRHEVLIVLNHTGDPCEVPLPDGWRAAETNAAALTLAARDVQLLTRARSATPQECVP